jgi:hypothetical protein
MNNAHASCILKCFDVQFVVFLLNGHHKYHSDISNQKFAAWFPQQDLDFLSDKSIAVDGLQTSPPIVFRLEL